MHLGAIRNELGDIPMIKNMDYFINYFLSEDSSSISNQIQNLIFHDCFYRTFNYGLKIEIKKNNYQPSFFLEHFHNDYFLRQAADLRKFYEYPSRDKRKKTYSILTVIQEIKNNYRLFTFSNYLNLPIQNSDKFKITTEIRNWCNNKRTTTFKLLSQNKNPQLVDTISLSLLEEIEIYITKTKKKLDYHLNKFWLHCSDPDTRDNPSIEKRLLTLNYLQNLLKTAVWSIKTLSKYFDILVLCEMPTFTYDPLIGCNIVFVPSTLRKCERFFSQRYRLYNSWSQQYSKDELIYTNLRTYKA